MKKNNVVFVAVQFDYDDTNYSRLLDVLEKSIALNCQSAEIHSIRCDAPPLTEYEKKNKFCFKENSEKLRLWNKCLKELDYENFIFIDCDMIILKDLSDVFNNNFDIAITRRLNYDRIPFNGGIFFVKKNTRSKEFFDKFLSVNDQMYRDKSFHKPWREKYAGMNQSAFGWMYEKYDRDKISFLELPCSIYNANSHDWKKIDENTKVIHIKGQLRDCCLGKYDNPSYRHIVKIWRDIEAHDIS